MRTGIVQRLVGRSFIRGLSVRQSLSSVSQLVCKSNSQRAVREGGREEVVQQLVAWSADRSIEYLKE